MCLVVRWPSAGLLCDASVARVLCCQILFVISQPDVYKSPSSDTYIVFGEAKIEDLSAQAQASAAEQFRAPDMSKVAQGAAAAAVADDDDTEDLDASSLNAADIDLVIKQAGVSRNKAIKALLNNGGDMVNAIMELTS